jgi:hypothetical protein
MPNKRESFTHFSAVALTQKSHQPTCRLMRSLPAATDSRQELDLAPVIKRKHPYLAGLITRPVPNEARPEVY